MLPKLVSNTWNQAIHLPRPPKVLGLHTGMSHRAWAQPAGFIYFFNQGLNSSPLLDTSEVFKKSSHQLQLTFEEQIKRWL